MKGLAMASAGLQTADVALTQLAEHGSSAVHTLSQAVTDARAEVDSAIRRVESDD